MPAQRVVKTQAGAKRYKVPIGSTVPSGRKTSSAYKARPRVRTQSGDAATSLRARDDERLLTEARLNRQHNTLSAAYRTTLTKELARRGYHFSDLDPGAKTADRAQGQLRRRKRAGVAGKNPVQVTARKAGTPKQVAATVTSSAQRRRTRSTRKDRTVNVAAKKRARALG